MPRRKRADTVIEEYNENSETVSALSSSSDGRDNGNGEFTGTGDGTGTSGDSSTDSGDSATAGLEFAGFGRAGGENSEVGSETSGDRDDLPIGAESSGVRKRTNRRNAAGTGARGGGRGRTRSDPGRGQTETETRIPGDDVPRSVGFDQLGKSKPNAKQQVSIAFLAEGLTIGFEYTGKALNDPEWSLPADDAQELADRLHKWLRSGGSKRIAAFEKFVARWEPLLGLVFGLMTVLIPRILHTWNRNRAIAIAKKAATTGQSRNATATEVSPSVDGHGSPVSFSGVAAPTRGPGANGAGERSIRREDFIELYGQHEQ